VYVKLGAVLTLVKLGAMWTVLQLGAMLPLVKLGAMLIYVICSAYSKFCIKKDFLGLNFLSGDVGWLCEEDSIYKCK